MVEIAIENRTDSGLGVDFAVSDPPAWLASGFRTDSSSCHQFTLNNDFRRRYGGPDGARCLG